MRPKLHPSIDTLSPAPKPPQNIDGESRRFAELEHNLIRLSSNNGIKNGSLVIIVRISKRVVLRFEDESSRFNLIFHADRINAMQCFSVPQSGTGFGHIRQRRRRGLSRRNPGRSMARTLYVLAGVRRRDRRRSRILGVSHHPGTEIPAYLLNLHFRRIPIDIVATRMQTD